MDINAALIRINAAALVVPLLQARQANNARADGVVSAYGRVWIQGRARAAAATLTEATQQRITIAYFFDHRMSTGRRAQGMKQTAAAEARSGNGKNGQQLHAVRQVQALHGQNDQRQGRPAAMGIATMQLAHQARPIKRGAMSYLQHKNTFLFSKRQAGQYGWVQNLPRLRFASRASYR